MQKKTHKTKHYEIVQAKPSTLADPWLPPLKARVGERMLGSMFGGLSPSFSASPRGGLPGLPLK